MDTHLESQVREAVGVFHNMDDLQDAVRDLEGTAFPRQDISVMGDRKDIEDIFGSATMPPELMEDDPNTPRQSPVRPEEKTIGASALVGGTAYVGAVAAAIAAGAASIPAVIAAAALGGMGGAAAGGTAWQMIRHYLGHAEEEQFEKGGMLLWVRTPDKDREEIACGIMRSHGADHVRVHDIV